MQAPERPVVASGCPRDKRAVIQHEPRVDLAHDAVDPLQLIQHLGQICGGSAAGVLLDQRGRQHIAAFRNLCPAQGRRDLRGHPFDLVDRKRRLVLNAEGEALGKVAAVLACDLGGRGDLQRAARAHGRDVCKTPCSLTDALKLRLKAGYKALSVVGALLFGVALELAEDSGQLGLRILAQRQQIGADLGAEVDKLLR